MFFFIIALGLVFLGVVLRVLGAVFGVLCNFVMDPIGTVLHFVTLISGLIAVFGGIIWFLSGGEGFFDGIQQWTVMAVIVWVAAMVFAGWFYSRESE